MRTFKLILLGLITFLITAIWLTPAAFVAPYIERFAPNVQINHASGTIWNGQAGSVRVNQFDLGRVNWKAHPFKSLFSLAVVTDFEVNGRELNATGNAAYGHDRSIQLSTVQFDAEASIVKRFQPQVGLTGNLQGLIDDAQIKPGGFPSINGLVNLVQLGIVFPSVAPGNYRADISSENDTLIANISSADSPLSLSGKASINSAWQYESDLIAKANAGLNPMVMNLLRPVAGNNPNPDGSLRINRKGKIAPIKLY
ncbi:MAG: type II secretion system protein N [Leucothrix sp.]